MRRFHVWAHLPNRHTKPLLEAAHRIGLLAGVVYDSEKPSGAQLGTPAAVDAAFERVVDARDRKQVVREVVRRFTGPHLMFGFAGGACREAMRQCAAEGREFFVFGERLLPRKRFSPRRLVRDALYARLVRRAAGAFALGRGAAEDFAQLGVAASRIVPGAYVGPLWRRTQSRGVGRRVVFCGRLVHTKGTDVLAKAFRLISAEERDLELHVVGDGPEQKHLRRLTHGLPIVFHGAQPTVTVQEHLQDAAVVVVPTRYWEGWGYIVNECVMVGTPVVVSDTVAARELVVEGRNGLVCQAEDVAALAGAIQRALCFPNAPNIPDEDVVVMRAGLDPEACAKYVAGVMGGALSAEAPWHAACRRLGGNAEVKWWDAWRTARPVLRADA